MTRRYNPPPNWPQPPSGWEPPADWQPDPAWGSAPEGWQLWSDAPDGPAALRWYRRRWAQLLAVALMAFLVGGVVGNSSGRTSESRAVAAEAQIDEATKRAETAEKQRDQARQDAAKAQNDAAAAAAQARVDAEAELAAERQRLIDIDAAVKGREAAVGKAEVAVAANTFPGDGTFEIGSEVKPGTYKSAGGEGCYWERLKGAAGDFDDIIANDNPSGQTTVTIKPGDKFFSTARCGEWTRR